MPEPLEKARAPVWATKHIAIDSCPRSYITAESQCLVEEFLVRRRLGGLRVDDLSARQAEAFLILEQELTVEMTDGRQHTRHSV